MSGALLISSTDRDRLAQLLFGWRRERCGAVAGVGQVGVGDLGARHARRLWLGLSRTTPPPASSAAVQRVVSDAGRDANAQRRCPPSPPPYLPLATPRKAAEAQRAQDVVLFERVRIGI